MDQNEIAAIVMLILFIFVMCINCGCNLYCMCAQDDD